MAIIRKRVWKNKEGEQEAWIVDYVDQHGDRHIKTFCAKEGRRIVEGPDGR